VNPVFGSSSTTFTVDFEPLVGNFSFDLVISAVAPNLTGNSFTVTVQGVAEPPEAEIDVQRPAGTSLANGQTDGQGTVTAGVPQVLSYTIENTGAVDLELTSLTIENEDNVLAGFTNIPGGLVGPNETTTVDVQYQVEGEGPFSYQMLIVNNDVDESVYTIIVSGDGEDQGGTGGAGGGGVGGGDGGGGLVGGSGGGSPGDDDDDDGDEDGADDGCGCRVAGTPSSSPWALAAFGLVGLGLARRRVTTPRRPARRG